MQHLVPFMNLPHCKVLSTTKTFKRLHDAKYLIDTKYHLSYQILQAIHETKFGAQAWTKWNLWKTAFKKIEVIWSA